VYQFTHKTKIVCTVGPASSSQEVLEKMLRSGMNVARLNFSHGEFAVHEQNIMTLRRAAAACGHRLAIMADLSGPKMRIGLLEQEPIQLNAGDRFSLTPDDIVGDTTRASVTVRDLAQLVKRGDRLFLNDGLIPLKVSDIAGGDVVCEVLAGGELRSRKGLNLPGIDLGSSAFTEHDNRCLEFALGQGVDAVSQSFVAGATDVKLLRERAYELGYAPFIIAKIERSIALEHLEEILEAADGVMLARGDLGVEIPIARMAVVQKELISLANRMCKPVITATQMLESMTDSPRPTRAEATDVANAILDGTDAVMLSAESAIGGFPVESVSMLASIAAETEPTITLQHEQRRQDHAMLENAIANNLQQMVRSLRPAAVVVPTRSGSIARNVASFRTSSWITAFSTCEGTCQNLLFSYGIYPVLVEREYGDWTRFSRKWLRQHGIRSGLVVMAQGPSPERPNANHRLEIFEISSENDA
jgi:pyruvate kinase